METVDHEGRTTAFREVGDGSPAKVLYVHGSGADHRVWAAQYGPDGPAHPAVALDLSGHGESDDVDTDPGRATLDAYAADVAAVADATDPAVIVGHSLGGAVVLHAVLAGTVEPAAIVLAGTGAKLTVADTLREGLAMDFDAAVDALHDDDRLFHGSSPEMHRRSKAAMRAVGRSVTRRDFLTCHAFDVRDRLAEIESPTLALCGEYDELTPPSYHEYLAENVQRGRFETVPDAAHLAMVERPKSFNRRIEEFLDSVDVL